MMRVLGIVMVSVLASTAQAKGPGWFLAGADAVEIEGEVQVPLLRGEESRYRPAVMASLGGLKDPHDVLVVLDVGHAWTRMGRRLARRMGIAPASTTLRGAWTQTAVLPQLVIGDLILRDLRVEVVEGSELVLGLGTLPALAVAIRPSTGQVTFVEASQGAALVRAVGTPIPITVQSQGGFAFAGERAYGNGLSVSIPGAIAGRDGSIGIQTDSAISRVTRSYQASEPRRRKGVVHYRGRGRLQQVELPESWLMQDESLASPSSDFVGALGYDQLYKVDVAVSMADRIMAIASVEAPQWTGTTEAALRLARQRYDAGGYDLEEESTQPPRLGFDDPAQSDPAGDQGDAKRRQRAIDLANALWSAGRLDEALLHDREATLAAGDHCDPYRQLGLRRLAWSGGLQDQAFITELIRQPLRQAGELWDRWAQLTPELREKIRRYEDVPTGTFAIQQDVRCRTAWGVLMASYVRQGNTRAASSIYKQHHGTDPLVAFAQGLSLLERKQPKTAEIPIRQALSYQVAEHGDIKLGLGAAQAAQGLQKPVEALVAEIPGLEIQHGITAALIAASWGRQLDGDAGAKRMAGLLIDEDRYWIPGQLLGLWLGVEQADPNQLGAELVRQIPRDAGAQRVLIERATYRAIQGEPAEALASLQALQKSSPPTPDLYAALAWVHTIRGEPEARDHAFNELRLRFPVIAIGRLDVLQSL